MMIGLLPSSISSLLLSPHFSLLFSKKISLKMLLMNTLKHTATYKVGDYSLILLYFSGSYLLFGILSFSSMEVRSWSRMNHLFHPVERLD